MRHLVPVLSLLLALIPSATASARAGAAPAGRWSAADTNRAVAILLRGCLASPWLARFGRRHGRPPVIKVVRVHNRAFEPLDGHAMTAAIERALLRSQRVKVASTLPATSATSHAGSDRAAKGRGTAAADLILGGWFVAWGDFHGRQLLDHRALVLHLIDVSTAEKVWLQRYDVTRLVTAPSSPGERAPVRTLGPDEQLDLSGHLTAADARRIATELAQDLARSLARSKRAAIIRPYPLRNRTAEQIPSHYLTMVMAQQLIGTPAVRWLATLEETQEIRAELLRQARYATDATWKGPGQELAASAILNGWITARGAGGPGGARTSYTVAMELLDPDSGHKLWAGAKRLDKVTPSRR